MKKFFDIIYKIIKWTFLIIFGVFLGLAEAVKKDK